MAEFRGLHIVLLFCSVLVPLSYFLSFLPGDAGYHPRFWETFEKVKEERGRGLKSCPKRVEYPARYSFCFFFLSRVTVLNSVTRFSTTPAAIKLTKTA